MAETIDNDTGEIVGGLAEMGSSGGSLIATIMRAEIDAQVATAHAFPRKPAIVVKDLDALVSMSVEAAQECIYSLPRGGKPIRGPSIRFAEALFQSWGNGMVEAKVVHVDREEKVVIAEGSYRDLQTGAWTRVNVRRRISDKNGKIYNDDMITITGNAACSIARRNVTLAGIPKLVWGAAFEKAQDTVAGRAEPIAVTRDKAVNAFATYGIKPEQVYAAIGVNGPEEVQRDHIITLRGMFSTIKNDEATIEEVFNMKAPGTAPDRTKGVADPLGTSKKKDANKEPAKSETTDDAAGGRHTIADAGKGGETSSTVSPSDQSKESAAEQQGSAVSGEGATAGGDQATAATDKDAAGEADKKPAASEPSKAKPPKEEKKPAPKNEAEYIDYARAMFAAATSGTQLEADFKHKSERDLRTSVNIGAEAMAMLKEEAATRVAELKGE